MRFLLAVGFNHRCGG